MVGFLLPMLQIAPFSLYAIVNSLTSKKKDDSKDLTKGDITLLEHDNVLMANTFSLACKYICCFAIRVRFLNVYLLRFLFQFCYRFLQQCWPQLFTADI